MSTAESLERNGRLIQEKSPGFDKENLVLLSADSQRVTQNCETFRSLLLKDPRILQIHSGTNRAATLSHPTFENMF